MLCKNVNMATLSQLLTLPELQLRLVQAGPGDPEISWSATTELVNLSGYLEGGEFIMTTGLALTGEDARWRDFVASLSRAQVAAIGFGTGVTHDRVPAPLVRAASEYRVALIEIPLPTPFIAVSKAIAELLRADELRATRSALTAHQQLLDSARGEQEPAEVLASLALATGRHLAISTSSGALVASTAGFRSGEHTNSAVERVALDPDASVHLLIAGDTPLGPQGRSVIAAGAIVLGLSMRGDSQAQRRERQQWERLTAGLLDHSLEPSSMHVLDPDLPLPSRVRAVAVQGTAEDVLSWREDVRTGFERLVTPSRTETRAPGLALAWQICVDTDEAISGALTVAARHQLDAVVGRPSPLHTVGISRRSAAAQLSRLSITAPLYALPRVPRVIHADRHVPILDALVQAGMSASVTHDVLGPLSLHGTSDGPASADPLSAAERDSLRETLEAFFLENGQRGPAAARLGIHRNTLRDRLTRIERLTQRSLMHPDDRSEMWLALRAEDLHE